MCPYVQAIGPAAPASICPGIAAAIDIPLGGPTGEGVIIFAWCLKLFVSAELYCSTLGFSQPAAPNFGEFLCGAIPEVVDRFTRTEVFLSPSAKIPGIGFFVAKGQMAPASGPFPEFTIDAGGEVAISSFTTDPVDPASFQSYVATAEITCAPPGTQVVMSIVGSDGFTDSSTCIIDGSAACNLSVD